MTSRLTVGATMYSAPASSTARAVSGSRTVPAPSRIRSPSACRTCRSTSRALGTDMVISTTVTPPSAWDRHASTSFWLSGYRTTATMPHSSTCWSWVSLLMRLCLLLDERLRFDDGVLVGESVESGDDQAAGAALDVDETEGGQR